VVDLSSVRLGRLASRGAHLLDFPLTSWFPKTNPRDRVQNHPLASNRVTHHPRLHLEVVK
jgi:hypothetical protein